MAKNTLFCYHVIYFTSTAVHARVRACACHYSYDYHQHYHRLLLSRFLHVGQIHFPFTLFFTDNPTHAK